MMDFFIIAAPALAVAMIYCLWRAERLFRTWNPAVATLLHTDYSNAERALDAQLDDAVDRVIFFFPGLSSRTTLDEFLFTDHSGVRRHVGVEYRVRKGSAREFVHIIWYDPADPQRRVTAVGPWRWLKRAAMLGAALAALLHYGPLGNGDLGHDLDRLFSRPDRAAALETN